MLLRLRAGAPIKAVSERHGSMPATLRAGSLSQLTRLQRAPGAVPRAAPAPHEHGGLQLVSWQVPVMHPNCALPHVVWSSQDAPVVYPGRTVQASPGSHAASRSHPWWLSATFNFAHKPVPSPV
jgi:hypothetical protein